MVAMSKAKAEPRALPKRFYAAANAVPDEGGFIIALDGKKVRTPQQQLLRCASQQLAQQIAAEWDAQKEVIDTDTMPLTRLLNIALDRVAADRDALLFDIAQYGETDLLCYRALKGGDALIRDDAAAELFALQQKHFAPVLEWAEEEYGLEFVLTGGVMPVAQPPESLEKLTELYAEASNHELAALAMLVPLLGSALLTLAVWQGEITIEEALIAARLDEAVQQKYWGADAETAAKWDAKCRDARAAAFFLTGK